ncbi:MAG: hemoglobin [Bacteroidetes bacterium]|nr:hemoglobin [Bacteroidota bacterium]
MLSEHQIQLIKHSWRHLRNVDPVIIGNVFYAKLFIDAPEVKRMFGNSQEEQSKKLIDMLSLLVARLDNITLLTDDIKQLGQRHVDYGVKDKHYDYVGAALIWTLKLALKNEWNIELENAWIDCYNLIANAMRS